MMLEFFALCALSVTDVTAQPYRFTSSPNGYGSSEGESSLSLIASEATLRYQQIDTTNGPKTNMNRVAFRRDGVLPTNASYVARQIQMELVMSESDLASMSTIFDCNYKTNTTVVFTRKTVNLASWVLPGPGTPQARSNTINLDTLWSYPATGNDLLWEVRVYSNSQAGQPYPFDFALPSADEVANVATGVSLGTGCTAGGQSSPMTLSTHFVNTGARYVFDFEIDQGAANQPHAVLVGFQTLGAPVPGLCAALWPGGPTLVSLFGGTTDAAGHVHSCVRFPNLRGVGVPLTMQAHAFDATQAGIPVTSSNGSRLAIQAHPGRQNAVGYMASRKGPNDWHEAELGIFKGGAIILTNHQ